MKKLSAREIDILNSCKPKELDVVLSHYYSLAVQEALDDGKITYCKNNDCNTDCLKLSFSNQSERISGAEISDKKVFEEIERDINNFIYKTEIKYSYLPILTSKNITDNYYLQSNKILIRPVVDPVPITQLLIQSNYPAILEFQYEGSQNWQINLARMIRKKAEILWALNTVLKFSIIEAEFDNVDYYGFEPKDDITKQIPNVIFRKGYFVQDFEAILPLINSNKSNEILIWRKLKLSPFGVTDNTSYLSDDLFGYDQLFVPYYSYQILERASDLNDSKRDLFLKASYWFNKAVTEKQTNKAAIIIALASALESLIDQESKKCNTCSQPVYSINKRVISLIYNYCGVFIDKDEDLGKTVKKFYDVRSKVVHASSLPYFDIDNERGFDPIINKIVFKIDYYIFIVRCVILNWYLDRKLTQDLFHIKHKIAWLTESNKRIGF